MLLWGSTATVAGLKSRPELNGKVATIRSFNDEKGRYNAEVEGEGVMALKAENLLQDDQSADAVLPAAKALESEEYPMAEVLRVMEKVDAMEEYHADVAVVCLTRCVEALMEEAGRRQVSLDGLREEMGAAFKHSRRSVMR